MKMTFYLFNESVKQFDQAIVKDKFSGDESFEEVEFKNVLTFEAKLYLQRNRSTTPKWLGCRPKWPTSVHRVTRA